MARCRKLVRSEGLVGVEINTYRFIYVWLTSPSCAEVYVTCGIYICIYPATSPSCSEVYNINMCYVRLHKQSCTCTLSYILCCLRGPHEGGCGCAVGRLLLSRPDDDDSQAACKAGKSLGLALHVCSQRVVAVVVLACSCLMHTC